MSEYPITSLSELMDKVSGSDLYPKFLAQLQKDFNRAGVEYTIKDSTAPKTLFVQIKQLLIEKLQYSFNDYVNLLYAVDVSEAEIRAVASEKIEDIAAYASFLIMKREWQKVWYRDNY